MINYLWINGVFNVTCPHVRWLQQYRIRSYWLMLAWKANEKIDLDFVDCQLKDEINSENEDYIKRRFRERINMAGTFIQLIGEDTHYKYRYVR